MESVVYVALFGLQVGCIYALLGLSYYVILSATGILNFAQGEWMMLSAVFGVSLINFALPYPLALVLSILFATALAVLSERLIIRPLQQRQANLDILILALFGIMIVLRYSTGLWFGREDQPLPGPAGSAPLVLGPGMFVLPQTLVIYASTAVAFAGYFHFVKRTWTGRSLRVAAIDPVGAQLSGVSLGQVRLVAFALGGGIAAAVGWLYAPLYAAGYFIGLVPGIKGFIVLILGGIGSPWGALIGGLALGVLELVTARYISSSYADGIAFVVLIAVLLVRPTGLVATKWVRA